MRFKLGEFNTVLDDRGTRIKVHNANPATAADDPELAGVLQRVNESRLAEQRFGQMILFGLLGGFFIVSVSIVLSRWLPTLPAWLTPIFTVLVILAFAFALSLRERPKRLHRLVESLLFAGRCAGCGYDLREQPDAPDGLRICPECSAAWRAQRIGSAVPPRSDLPLPAETSGDIPPLLTNYVRNARRSGAVADDRDRSVPVIHYTLPGVDSWMSPSDAALVRTQLRRATAGTRVGCGLVIVLFVVVVIGIQIFKIFIGGPTGAIFPVIIIIAMGGPMSLTAYRFWTGRSGGVNRTIVTLLKARSICPSCTTNLASQPSEIDGCVICPQCRAAWKLPAVHPATTPRTP